MIEALVEYTDTFGGDANYSWVNRQTLHVEEGISDAALMRRAKKAIGLNGVRGRTDSFLGGDHLAFYPYRTATVMLVTIVY